MRNVSLQMTSFLVVLVASLPALVNGQPDPGVLPDLPRDDCIMAALCNLIKGDVTIESQGNPGLYYDLAIRNLQKSQKHKNCPVEVIFSNCRKQRLECESDINVLARNTFGIPLKLLTTCPYLTWPFMLFNCQNYKNWPRPAILMIPEICRSCQTQCYLLEEFETFQRKLNLTDFPPNWEGLKKVSKFIKSAIEKTERRQGSSSTYPWAGTPTRTANDLFETKSSGHLDPHGMFGPEIFCPPNHYIDIVEELYAYSPIRFSYLRFRCSEFSNEGRARELWTHELGQTASKTTSCYIPGQSRFIVGIEVNRATWRFTCRGSGEMSSNPLHCPRYTAACSVKPYYYTKSYIVTGDVYPLYGLNFGCCTLRLPKIMLECGNSPMFTLKEIEVKCSQRANSELKDCFYKSNYGLLVNDVLNTTVQTEFIAFQHANAFEEILAAYSSSDPTKIRYRFDWRNVPEITRQLAIDVSHNEIVQNMFRFRRHQPTITCGKYIIRSRNQLNNFVPQTKNYADDYIESIMEGCTPGFLSSKRRNCLPAPQSSCIFPAFAMNPKCQICNVTFEYGIIPSPVVNLTINATSKLYERLLRSYKIRFPDDNNQWVNVPNTSSKNLETVIVENKQFEVAVKIGLPRVKCGSGTIIAKNPIERLVFFNGEYRTRIFRDGFIEAMMVELGCVPVYVTEEITGRLCLENPSGRNAPCDISTIAGYEIDPDVLETNATSLKKLQQIAVEVSEKMMPTNARFFNWTAVASKQKLIFLHRRQTVPPFLFRESQSRIFKTLLPTITCGEYKLYADVDQDLECIPTVALYPVRGFCTGCTEHPNINSLTVNESHLHYSNCGPFAKCSWTTRHGYQIFNFSAQPIQTVQTVTEKERRILQILVAILPRLTDLDHQRPFQPLNWEEAVRVGGVNMVNMPGANGFDRVIKVPEAQCGNVVLFSNVISIQLIKDIFATGK